MDNYLTMLEAFSFLEIAIILIVVLLIGATIVALLRRSRITQVDSPKPTDEYITPETELATSSSKSNNNTIGNIMALYGNGLYKAYMLLNGAVFPTTIDKPLGTLFLADTSMKRPGLCYLVTIEDLGDGPQLAAYDPRLKPLAANKTPQMGYLATHWDSALKVFSPLLSLWQNVNTWLAVGVLVITFLAVIIWLGG